MTRKRLLVGILSACMMLGASSTAVRGQGFANLRPGEPASLSERLPVTFVWVGIEPSKVDSSAFVSELPTRVSPIHRARALYDIDSPLGLTYDLAHQLVFTDSAYEDKFFGFLAGASKPAALTVFQENYNAQDGVLDISANHEIPAATVERWLAQNPPPGVDTTRNTVFFIDWYGRPDFRFHVFTKEQESTERPAGGGVEPPLITLGPPPDQAKMIAWGGTAADDPEDGNGVLRRVWFYDFSAGPDGWTRNWDVEGGRDIVPNSWEYADEGARAPDELTVDMARLARFVAIGTLFAPSPLYPVGLTAPGLPDHIEFDVNDYDRDAGPIARRLDLTPLPRTFEAVAPWLEFSVDLDPADFANPAHAACYPGWIAVLGPSCSPTNPGYFSMANLFLHHAKSRAQLFDNPKAYEAGGFIYPSPGPLGADCFGIAEDDFTTGTQSFVYVAGTPVCDSAIGFTAYLIHEYGHHIGLSHPHDGYDSELGEEFYAGVSPFIWAGTEVNSEMSYVGLNDEFSQFDQDNLARWWTAAYLSEANHLAKLALGARVSTSAFAEADRLAGESARRLANHEYLGAVAVAKSAFEQVRSITRAAGVNIPAPLPEPSAGVASAARAHPGAIDHLEPGKGYRR